MANQSYLEADTPLVPVGSHCILELYECPKDLLNDVDFIQKALEEGVKEADSTLLKELTYQFEPYGVTALALLAESHVSLHTWPEIGYIAIDMFTCGENAKPEKACKYLVKAFQAKNHVLLKIQRGRLTPQLKQLEESLLTVAS